MFQGHSKVIQWYEYIYIILKLFSIIGYYKFPCSFLSAQFSSVQLLNRVQLFVTPWTAAHQASLSTTNSQKLTQTHVHWVGDAIQPSHPLSSPYLLALSLFQHRDLFQLVSCSYQVAKIFFTERVGLCIVELVSSLGQAQSGASYSSSLLASCSL